MKAYLAVKFFEDCRNRAFIEELSALLKKIGFENSLLIRDYEKWGKVKFNGPELMSLAFNLIDNSDLIIVEFTEPGVGRSIEAGYAFSKGKPVIVLAKLESIIPITLAGIAKEILFYTSFEDLADKLGALRKRLENTC